MIVDNFIGSHDIILDSYNLTILFIFSAPAKSKINLDKILPRTKPGKYIPPAERLEDHKETCSPFYGAQYRDNAHSGGTTHSIQATDGECSLLPFKNIVCSSRPLYKSFKQSSTETNSSRSNSLYGRHSSCLARFPDMADLERRHASYLQEAWEIHTDRPDVKVLEDCGFFYTGKNWYFICHHAQYSFQVTGCFST